MHNRFINVTKRASIDMTWCRLWCTCDTFNECNTPDPPHICFCHRNKLFRYYTIVNASRKSQNDSNVLTYRYMFSDFFATVAYYQNRFHLHVKTARQTLTTTKKSTHFPKTVIFINILGNLEQKWVLRAINQNEKK